MAVVRAASWKNAMGRLGLYVPLFVIHDIGMLLTTPRGPTGWTIAQRAGQLGRIDASGPNRQLLTEYVELLENLAGSEVVEKLAGWRLRDELVAVLLTRALSDTYNRWPDPGKSAGAEDLPLDLGLYSDLDPASHFANFDSRRVWGFVQHLTSQALHVYTCDRAHRSRHGSPTWALSRRHGAWI